MILKTASGNSADFVAVIVRNVDGAGSFTQNLPVCFAVDGSSADGVGATHPTVIAGKAFAGVMRSTVAIDGYGFATAWGNHDSVLISGEGSSVTITAGDALTPIAVGAGLGMTSVGGETLAYTNMKYAIQTVTVGGSGVNGAYSQSLYTNNPIIRAL